MGSTAGVTTDHERADDAGDNGNDTGLHLSGVPNTEEESLRVLRAVKASARFAGGTARGM
jgi:hypothetical protein